MSSCVVCTRVWSRSTSSARRLSRSRRAKSSWPSSVASCTQHTPQSSHTLPLHKVAFGHGHQQRSFRPVQKRVLLYNILRWKQKWLFYAGKTLDTLTESFVARRGPQVTRSWNVGARRKNAYYITVHLDSRYRNELRVCGARRYWGWLSPEWRGGDLFGYEQLRNGMQDWHRAGLLARPWRVDVRAAAIRFILSPTSQDILTKFLHFGGRGVPLSFKNPLVESIIR